MQNVTNFALMYVSIVVVQLFMFINYLKESLVWSVGRWRRLINWKVINNASHVCQSSSCCYFSTAIVTLKCIQNCKFIFYVLNITFYISGQSSQVYEWWINPILHFCHCQSPAMILWSLGPVDTWDHTQTLTVTSPTPGTLLLCSGRYREGWTISWIQSHIIWRGKER